MNHKVLLIEDNSLDVSTFDLMLKRSGLQTGLFTCTTLAEGIQLTSELQPDIIFLDISLTDSDGISTFRDLKNHTGPIPVVIITGNENDELALLALREGAQDYLLKSKITPLLISRALLYAIERKKIETELQKSKASHEALIENTNDGIWSIDNEYRFTTLNSQFVESTTQLTGKTPKRGDCMLNFFPESSHMWLQSIFAKAFSGQRCRVETELQFKTQNIHIELSVNPVKHRGDEISGISFFARNIDQRKAAEHKIKKSEEAYKLLLETINEGVMFIDNENIIQFANRKFLESTGYSSEDITGMNFSALFPESDPYHQKNIVAEILDKEDRREIRILHKSGKPVWFSVKGTPLMNEKGVVGGTLLTHTEITERKKAEQAIRKKEKDYSNLIDTMNEGLVFLDTEGKLKFANNKFETLTGYSATTLLGHELPEKLLPVPVTEIMQAASEGERHFQYETQITQNSGDKLWCHVNCSLLEDESHSPSGILITWSDISVRKKTEARLTVAQRELNTFIYRSSHDLKGPLSSILGLINIFEKEEAGATHNPCIKMIRQSAEKLDKMLNEMLNVVRIKKEKIFPEPIDFYSQINEIVVGLRTSDAFYDVQRKIAIENKKTLHTDKKLFNLILNNLMDNAIKYRDVSKNSFVAVTIKDYMHGVHIYVEDNGTGFTGATRDNIFNMFNKGNYNSEGNGLGLYVVKNAVERLGGFIELSCEPGSNTLFTIFLPDLFSANQWVEQEADMV